MQQYSSRDHISREILLDWLNKLEDSSCKRINRKGIFAEEEIDFEELDFLLDKVLNDLEYQEHIARTALEMYGSRPQLSLDTYYWEVDTDSTGFLSKQKYISISLVLKTTDRDRGRILFPVMIVKCESGAFKYWEIINMEDALGAVTSLMES